jgi:hypothetical protein
MINLGLEPHEVTQPPTKAGNFACAFVTFLSAEAALRCVSVMNHRADGAITPWYVQAGVATMWELFYVFVFSL